MPNSQRGLTLDKLEKNTLIGGQNTAPTHSVINITDVNHNNNALHTNLDMPNYSLQNVYFRFFLLYFLKVAE